MEAIPDSPRQKGSTLFRTYQRVLRTQQLVGFRSLAIRTAASTPLPALGRSFSIPERIIRPLVRRLFCSTAMARTTPELERLPLKTTLLGTEIRPTERSRSLATP